MGGFRKQFILPLFKIIYIPLGFNGEITQSFFFRYILTVLHLYFVCGISYWVRLSVMHWNLVIAIIRCVDVVIAANFPVGKALENPPVLVLLVIQLWLELEWSIIRFQNAFSISDPAEQFINSLRPDGLFSVGTISFSTLPHSNSFTKSNQS